MSDQTVYQDFSPEIGKISTALCAAQSELDNAKKDSSGYGYNYSDLSSVISAAKPTLTKNGLAVVQLIGSSSNDNAVITTILTHSSGEYFKSTATIPLIDMKGCNKAQSFGASISYLRRYSYQAILGMTSEDNDASSGKNSDKPKTTETKNTTESTKTSAPSAWK